jgi:hypothetical protein
MPGGGIAVTSQPAVVTAQPAVATIPAGLPDGVTSYPYVIGNNSVTYIQLSIGSSSTVVLGSLPSGVTSVAGAGTTGSSSSNGNNSNDNENDSSSTNSDSPSGTGSSSSSETSQGAASSNMVVASGAMMGLGAFIAALL